MMYQEMKNKKDPKCLNNNEYLLLYIYIYIYMHSFPPVIRNLRLLLSKKLRLLAYI